MSQTLSMIIDQDEINALEVFHLILTYAGLMQINKEENTNGQNSVWFQIFYHLLAFKPFRLEF